MSYGEGRYEYATSSVDGNEYYIDTQSVAYINAPDTVRFWRKGTISTASRRKYIADARTKKQRDMLRKLSSRIDCIEINFRQNTYHIIDTIYYDARGNVLDSITTTWSNWNNIPPNSVIEGVRDAVKWIIQGSPDGRRLPQPFLAPPQSQMPQSRTHLYTPEQQEAYQNLQKYIAWLFSRDDFSIFNYWASSKLRQHVVTAEKLSTGLDEYIRLRNGDYAGVQAVLASWYRQFYMERYGSR